MIEWRPEYSVGDAMLDAQHKSLLNLCAKAEALIGQERTQELDEKFSDLLNDIRVYAQVHFATEEDLLRQLKYEDVKGQEDSHKAYIEKMANLIIESMWGKSDPAAVYRFLTSWWIRHIVVDDMKFKPIVQSRN